MLTRLHACTLHAYSCDGWSRVCKQGESIRIEDARIEDAVWYLNPDSGIGVAVLYHIVRVNEIGIEVTHRDNKLLVKFRIWCLCCIML